MDRSGVRKVPEGSGVQGEMEKTGCEIICGAPTTLAVKGLMMVMVLARPDSLMGDMSISLKFASLYDGQQVFVWSNCLLDLVCVVQLPAGSCVHGPIACWILCMWSNCLLDLGRDCLIHDLYFSLELCCDGP